MTKSGLFERKHFEFYDFRTKFGNLVNICPNFVFPDFFAFELQLDLLTEGGSASAEKNKNEFRVNLAQKFNISNSLKILNININKFQLPKKFVYCFNGIGAMKNLTSSEKHVIISNAKIVTF